MSQSLECLLQLRECTIQGKKPDVDNDGFVSFGKGTKYPLETKTAWHAKTSEDFYTLRALILFLDHAEVPTGQYIRAATAAKVKFVSNVERRELLGYLRGEAETSEQIQAPLQLGGDASLTGLANEGPSALKRQRSADGAISTLIEGGGLTEEQLRDAKLRHAEKLAGRGTGSRAGLMRAGVEGTDVEGMSAMSGEKLAELRAKRALQKRSTFSPDLIVGIDGREDDGSVNPAFLEADREIVAKIQAKEIRVTDRNSVLRRRGKDFKFALDYYTEVRRKEKEMAKEKDDASYGKKRRVSVGGSGGVAGGGSVPDRGDRSSHAPTPSPGAAPAPTVIPIIIVPNMPTAIINLHNAKEFLEEGRFVHSANSSASKKIAERKPTELKIERNLSNGRQMQYRIVDNPVRLRQREWENVVCVVVQGAAWQFKGWEWDQPVTLFQHALGVHVKYDDIRVDARVASWNVRVLEINKYKRYLDKGASLEFWRMLDEFMLVHKPAMVKPPS